MPLHSQFAANRVEITARTFASSLRVSEFRLEADSAHLLLLSVGEAEITQGDKRLDVPSPGLIWLPIGPAGRVRLSAGSRGSLLTTTEIGLAHAMPTGTSANAVRAILQRILVQTPEEQGQKELEAYLQTIASENVRAATGPTRSSPACSASPLSGSVSTPSPMLLPPSPRRAVSPNVSSFW